MNELVDLSNSKIKYCEEFKNLGYKADLFTYYCFLTSSNNITLNLLRGYNRSYTFIFKCNRRFNLKVSLILSAVIAMGAASASVTKLKPVDVYKEFTKEIKRAKKGVAPRFAVVNKVRINPFKKTNFTIKNGRAVWSHKIESKNSVSLNIAFKDIKLSKNATLAIFSSKIDTRIETFTQNDIKLSKLWSPIFMTDELSVEFSAPVEELNENFFILHRINQGFRTFSQKLNTKSGSCNVDVACSESVGWENEVNSVAVISTGGSTFCTGFMVNNTAKDRKPLFMTAAHCGIRSWNADSLVAYWNYQTSSCGGDRDGQLSQYTTGAKFLASSHKSDFTLVELVTKPQPAFNVQYAGWDRSGEDAKTAVAIHHPSTDEKSISYEYDGTTVTSYGENDIPGDGTHVKVADWDVGTTEPGSSGSPLFNESHRVIGQLHGGYASCSSQTADWYGRLYTSWEGDGTDSTSLKKWLDPINSGDLVTDTL